MRRLVGELARYGCEPLRAGEFVSTGTLTQALPATPVGYGEARLDPLGTDRVNHGLEIRPILAFWRALTKSVVPWSRSTALIV